VGRWFDGRRPRPRALPGHRPGGAFPPPSRRR
jgi:hypothetical protein